MGLTVVLSVVLLADYPENYRLVGTDPVKWPFYVRSYRSAPEKIWYLQHEKRIYNWLCDMFGDENDKWMLAPRGWLFTDQSNASIFVLAWGQDE